MTRSEKINLQNDLAKAVSISQSGEKIEITFPSQSDAILFHQLLWNIRAGELVKNHDTF